MAVLRIFGVGAERLTISDVADRTGQSRASARRNLRTLQKLGYARLEGRHFSLTPRVLELGTSFYQSQPICRAADHVLTALANATGAVASITMLDGTDVTYVLRVVPEIPVRSGIVVGARFDAHVTASGHVLLAELHHNQFANYLRGARLGAGSGALVADEETLRTLVGQVAARGWSCVRGEVEADAAGISVPLRGPDRRIVAALNLDTSVERAHDDALATLYLPALRDAASRIERAAKGG